MGVWDRTKRQLHASHDFSGSWQPTLSVSSIKEAQSMDTLAVDPIPVDIRPCLSCHEDFLLHHPPESHHTTPLDPYHLMDMALNLTR